MKRWTITILLTVCAALGCQAQQQVLLVEPVRFEDGTSVDKEEAGRLAEIWNAVGYRTGAAPETKGIQSGNAREPIPAEAAETAGRVLVPGARLDYSHRAVIGEDGVAGLLDSDPLRVETVIDRTDTLLTLKHASAFVRLQLEGLPAGGSIDRIDLVPLYGEITESADIDLETGAVTPKTGTQVLTWGNGASIPESGRLTLWTTLAPQDLGALAVIVHEGEGIRTARIPATALQSGMAYRWTVSCLPPDAPPPSLTASPLPQVIMDIDAGEYSGITHISGHRYAVVDDKLKGGGIVFFSIPIDAFGNVGTVSMQVADGTAQATGKARDCEGIAFDRSSGMLYVSSENQEIRGYDLAGKETGKAFRIPKDLDSKNIVANRGFEALTCNDSTGLFWTTTEAPLKKDTFLPRILRLQSFTPDGTPAERYFYQTGEPMKSSAGTSAYVHGVPALAALDDGRLLVLEREVYVPKGSFWDKLADSFTQTDLYLVDPVNDTAGILRKSLLCSFRTSALDLANFEGMCFGPTLPDGARCLLLIADSQRGSGGLTNEYVKVILLR